MVILIRCCAFIYKKSNSEWSRSIFGNYLTVEEISKQFGFQIAIPSIEVLHAYSNSSLVLKELFYEGNTTTNLTEPILNDQKKIVKIIDLLGRETKITKNIPVFYIYDDGTVEKNNY